MSECPNHDWMCDCKDSTIQWVDGEHQHPVLKGPGWFCMGCLAEFVPAKQFKDHLSTLLRAIHRDCGEYQAEVGTEKAVADAILVVQATVSAHARYIEERDAVQDERDRLIETMRKLNLLHLCGNEKREES